MQIQIHSRNLRIDDPLQGYVEKKLSRLEKYLPHISAIDIELVQEKQKKGGDRIIAQLTVRDERGAVLRAEEKKQNDIHAAVDMAVDKMYRQISRYKDKRRRRAGERYEVLEPDLAASEAPPIEAEVTDDLEEILRRKQVDLVPMSEEEAVDQMILLDHSFFMFLNGNTGQVNVLYRRENGGFGVLEPHLS
jgi:putative sigma-54 modulation protein